MSDNAIEFASLLCSRLCHDLLSPVGAVNNALELLADEDDPAMRAQVMQLLADSARASADRLKFFRLAFGAAGGFGEAIDAQELKSAIEGLVRANPRIALGWIVDRPALPKDQARILLILAMIGADALVRGGRLDVGCEGSEVVVRVEGARLVLDASIRAVLAGDADAPPLDSRSSAAWLARHLAESRHGSIAVASEQDGVLLLAAALG